MKTLDGRLGWSFEWVDLRLMKLTVIILDRFKQFAWRFKEKTQVEVQELKNTGWATIC